MAVEDKMKTWVETVIGIPGTNTLRCLETDIISWTSSKEPGLKGHHKICFIEVSPLGFLNSSGGKIRLVFDTPYGGKVSPSALNTMRERIASATQAGSVNACKERDLDGWFELNLAFACRKGESFSDAAMRTLTELFKVFGVKQHPRNAEFYGWFEIKQTTYVYYLGRWISYIDFLLIKHGLVDQRWVRDTNQ